jgi:hypothetical protein
MAASMAMETVLNDIYSFVQNNPWTSFIWTTFVPVSMYNISSLRFISKYSQSCFYFLEFLKMPLKGKSVHQILAWMSCFGTKHIEYLQERHRLIVMSYNFI